MLANFKFLSVSIFFRKYRYTGGRRGPTLLAAPSWPTPKRYPRIPTTCYHFDLRPFVSRVSRQLATIRNKLSASNCSTCSKYLSNLSFTPLAARSWPKPVRSWYIPTARYLLGSSFVRLTVQRVVRIWTTNTSLCLLRHYLYSCKMLRASTHILRK